MDHRANAYHDPERLAYVEHQGRLAKRQYAACFLICGRHVWIQLRYLRDADRKYIAIPQWLAKKLQLRSAW